MLAIAFAAAGSLLARFYRNPLVANVAAGLSVGIFISAASVIHLALLKRAMRFAATSTNDVVGRVVNTVVSILLALRGWGYWALVAGIVAQQLSMTVGAWWFCRMDSKLAAADRQDRRHGPVRGESLRAVQRSPTATQNIDNLLVGWRFNAVALGFYKKAYDLFALSASQLTAPLNNVALAALSRLNQDPARFRRYLANSLGIIAFVGMAVSADLTLVGKDVVSLVLGPQWSESGRIFEIFGPGIGAMLLYSTVGWVHLSIGKPGRWLRWNLVAASANRLLVSGGAALGACGSCRGVEHFLLDPFDSRLLVCRATDRVWCLSFDCRYLEVRCRGAAGGRSNCRDHPRHAILGYPFRHERCAGGNHCRFNTVCHALSGHGHPFSSGLGAAAPACQSSAGIGPVTEGHKTGRRNVWRIPMSQPAIHRERAAGKLSGAREKLTRSPR